MVKLCKSHIQNRGSEFGRHPAWHIEQAAENVLVAPASWPSQGGGGGAPTTAAGTAALHLARRWPGQPITQACDSDHRGLVMGEIPAGPRRSGGFGPNRSPAPPRLALAI